MPLFKKNKTEKSNTGNKNCSNCSLGELSTDETFIICQRRGRVEPGFYCIRHKELPKLNIVTKSDVNEISAAKTTMSPSSVVTKKVNNSADSSSSQAAEPDVDMEELKTLLKRIEARKMEFLDLD